jgi:hypothetical protein
MSRVRDGFVGAFFGKPLEDAEKLGREGSGFEAWGCASVGVASVCLGSASGGLPFAFDCGGET